MRNILYHSKNIYVHCFSLKYDWSLESYTWRWSEDHTYLVQIQKLRNVPILERMISSFQWLETLAYVIGNSIQHWLGRSGSEGRGNRHATKALSAGTVSASLELYSNKYGINKTSTRGATRPSGTWHSLLLQDLLVNLSLLSRFKIRPETMNT
jgi:hypothetical protein